MDIDQRKGYDPVTIVIHDRKRDAVYEDLSLIAFRRSSGKVLAAGEEAARLAGEENGNVVVLCPLKHGVVADYMAAQAMFRLLLRKARFRKGLFQPHVTVCVPPDLTEVEQKAFQDTFYRIGAKKVLLTEQTAEEVVQTLPRSFGIVIGIRRTEKRRKQREVWHEVCRGQIPPGDYRFLSSTREGTGMAVVLCSGSSRVELRFREVAAVRMLGRDAVSDGLYSQEELERFRENRLQSLIYEVEGGQLLRFLRENGRGISALLYHRHYLIAGSDLIIEVAAAQGPELTASPLGSWG